MAMITFSTEARVNAISAIASRIGGIDISPSITRMMMESSGRKNPETRPTKVPTTEATAATEKPTISEMRAPYSTREYTSRPSMSVPNQYSADGSRVRFAGASAVGSTVPSQGARMAIRIMTSSSAPPTTMVGWRWTKVITRPRCFGGGSTSASAGAAV